MAWLITVRGHQLASARVSGRGDGGVALLATGGLATGGLVTGGLVTGEVAA